MSRQQGLLEETHLFINILVICEDYLIVLLVFSVVTAIVDDGVE